MPSGQGEAGFQIEGAIRRGADECQFEVDGLSDTDLLVAQVNRECARSQIGNQNRSTV